MPGQFVWRHPLTVVATLRAMEISPNAHRFEPLEPTVRDLWMGYARWETEYYPKFVGLQMEDVRVDYCRMRLPWRDPQLIQPQGVMHGGAIASMIDTVVVPAIASAYSERRRMATINLAVNFIGPVVKSDIIGEGWVTKRGRSIVYCQVEIVDDRAAPVAFGTVVYRIGSPTEEFRDLG